MVSRLLFCVVLLTMLAGPCLGQRVSLRIPMVRPPSDKHKGHSSKHKPTNPLTAMFPMGFGVGPRGPFVGPPAPPWLQPGSGHAEPPRHSGRPPEPLPPPVVARPEERPAPAQPPAAVPNPLANLPVPNPIVAAAQQEDQDDDERPASWGAGTITVVTGGCLFGALLVTGLTLLIVNRRPAIPKYRRPRRREDEFSDTSA